MGLSVLSNPLTGSAKSVFRALAKSAPSTRPVLGAELGLSRPTMSAAIAELEKQKLVELVGEVQGAVGRKASNYRVGPGAGHVLAIDAGSTHIRLRLSTLDRRLLHSRVYKLASSQQQLSAEISLAVADEVAEAMRETRSEWGPLRSLGIALPSRVVGKDGDVASTGQNQIFSHFAPPPGVRVVMENNVNCAAVAEQIHGCAKGYDTFAFIQIGLKIGLGIVVSNQLVRGRNGSAGEIGHLTYPFAPGVAPEPGAIERYMGAEAFLRRVRTEWPSHAGAPPADTAELLSLAASGEKVAAGFVEQHATDIGRLVAACISVIDPGLVVLGGGLGASPQLLPGVQKEADRLAYPAKIVCSPLASDATVLGIESLAIEDALSSILAA
jgi:predicted NBD/HSP70 family sugar kinase